MTSDGSEALYHAVADQLLVLERLMREAELWQAAPPDAAALASPLPFCVDTLRFEQWLQFLFVPRMRLLVAERRSLPTAIALKPMAEEAFRNHPQCQLLIAHLGRLDLCLSQGGR
ncbi:YqcC family protein [Ferrimonas gelatinilytica]|uniref:YqcC family protein n=1 Tax=Ferrimonas gelatinilytica TaxID=1255257 RepID=A0ABP9S3R4_9GAMM